MVCPSGGTASSGVPTPGPPRACQVVGILGTTFHSTANFAMLYLMNASVIPAGSDGIWETVTIETESARMNLRRFEWVSAVGHESSAQVMSKALRVEIPCNRIQVSPEPGDRLLCFKLNGRAPEGVVLNEGQLLELGFSWNLMIYHGSLGRALDASFQAQKDMILAYAQR